MPPLKASQQEKALSSEWQNARQWRANPRLSESNANGKRREAKCVSLVSKMRS